MAISKTLFGTTHSIPESNEKSWGGDVTTLLSALADARVPAPASAPADGDLLANQVAFWIDEGTNTLKCKVKKSDNSVVSGDVTGVLS
jgi:hypothetical protein